ncbi:hypothetical protein FEZ41_08760 [Lentilactobacillus parafarraginis]|uniref:Uncharacterized protein n=1 Tax=Lentilactobacillus parafarraginis TaxID=390842 RepID=A0A5R9CTA5_9LACO|nr:hypothetical protein FEZ41_08760 [Lentilactobacillus parafarraginis]
MIGFANVICEHVLSTVLWITKIRLDIFQKNAGALIHRKSYQPVDNYVDNLFITRPFYTANHHEEI